MMNIFYGYELQTDKRQTMKDDKKSQLLQHSNFFLNAKKCIYELITNTMHVKI